MQPADFSVFVDVFADAVNLRMNGEDCPSKPTNLNEVSQRKGVVVSLYSLNSNRVNALCLKLPRGNYAGSRRPIIRHLSGIGSQRLCELGDRPIIGGFLVFLVIASTTYVLLRPSYTYGKPCICYQRFGSWQRVRQSVLAYPVSLLD